MEVILVGRPDVRARMRREAVAAGLDIAGEYPTISAARSAHAGGLAILLGSEATRAEATGELVEPLTHREIQVVALLVEGRSNKAIAAELGISDQTVKFHVASICGKLGAVNRTEAVRLALRRGLVTL